MLSSPSLPVKAFTDSIITVTRTAFGCFVVLGEGIRVDREDSESDLKVDES